MPTKPKVYKLSTLEKRQLDDCYRRLVIAGHIKVPAK